MNEYVVCPFCHEPDFDLEGLAMHLQRIGWCPVLQGINNREFDKATTQQKDE